MTSPLRVGVIGAGSWTRICHIPCLQADKRVEVTALCGRRTDMVSAQAAEFGIPRIYTNYEDLIANPNINAVTISTPNVNHYPIAMQAILAGKHVFCEKPLAMDAKQSAAMVQAATQAGLVHQVSFTFRHLFAAQLAKQLIGTGFIGSVYRVAGFAEGVSGLRPDRPYNWRDTLALAGSGMLGDMGSHVVDLVRFLTGHEFLTTNGYLRTLERPAANPTTAVTTDDETEFLATLTNGVTGYFRISRIVRGETRSYVEVNGTKGALRVHYSRGNIDALYHAPTGTGAFSLLPLPAGAVPEPNHALYKMLSAFVDECIGKGRPQAVATFVDGHKAQLVLDAVIASAATGQTCSL